MVHSMTFLHKNWLICGSSWEWMIIFAQCICQKYFKIGCQMLCTAYMSRKASVANSFITVFLNIRDPTEWDLLRSNCFFFDLGIECECRLECPHGRSRRITGSVVPSIMTLTFWFLKLNEPMQTSWKADFRNLSSFRSAKFRDINTSVSIAWNLHELKMTVEILWQDFARRSLQNTGWSCPKVTFCNEKMTCKLTLSIISQGKFALLNRGHPRIAQPFLNRERNAIELLPAALNCARPCFASICYMGIFVLSQDSKKSISVMAIRVDEPTQLLHVTLNVSQI